MAFVASTLWNPASEILATVPQFQNPPIWLTNPPPQRQTYITPKPIKPVRPFQNPHLDQDIATIRHPWLIEGILPEAALVILASPPKTGKTCLATAMALAVARGEDFAGKTTREATVLWCAYEENPWERKLLHDGISAETNYFIAYGQQLYPIDQFDDFTNTVIYAAGKMECRLIVIDCLHAAVRRSILSDNATARRVLQNLKEVSYEFNVTFLVLHHLTKSSSRASTTERFSDSHQILATATTQLLLDSNPSKSPRQFTLHAQGRFPVPDPVTHFESTGVQDYKICEAPTIKSAIPLDERIYEAIAELGTADATRIADSLGQSESTIRNTLTRLARHETVKVTKEGRKLLYSLPAEP